jgi:hypothetical protein
MSESAGASLTVQIAACFFLGTCFTALKDPVLPDSSENIGLTQKSFLTMIESRIGLTRFNELLKLPLKKSNSKSTGVQNDLDSNLFFGNGFKTFYESNVELIKNGIFQSYVGMIDGLNGNFNDAPLKQILQMQKEKITELELRINSGLTIINESSLSESTLLLSSQEDSIPSKELIDRIDALNTNKIELEELLLSSEERRNGVQKSIKALTGRVNEVIHIIF